MVKLGMEEGVGPDVDCEGMDVTVESRGAV